MNHPGCAFPSAPIPISTTPARPPSENRDVLCPPGFPRGRGVFYLAPEFLPRFRGQGWSCMIVPRAENSILNTRRRERVQSQSGGRR